MKVLGMNKAPFETVGMVSEKTGHSQEYTYKEYLLML